MATAQTAAIAQKACKPNTPYKYPDANVSAGGTSISFQRTIGDFGPQVISGHELGFIVHFKLTNSTPAS
jgi:hypothetical protein